MKILVTGSAGRVGRNIYIHLMRQYQVVGLDMTPCSTIDYIGDIRDPILIKSALKDVDFIVHAAALHAPHVGLRPDDDFIDINVRATEQLINMGIEQGISRFVYTSTTALYGYASTPKDKAGWVTEQVIPQPRTIYHQSKLQAERLLQRISEKNALPVTVQVRPRAPYLNDKASTKVGALLYLAQSYLLPRQVTLTSLKSYP